MAPVVHERPKYVPPLIRDRLFRLYCLGRFSYREMSEELAGWDWDAIKNALGKWRLVWTADLYHDAQDFFTYRLAKNQALPLDPDVRRLLLGSHQELQQWIREQGARGEGGWKEIDRLPGPDEVRRWVHEWEVGGRLGQHVA